MILFENRNDMIRYYLKPSMIGAELGVFAGEFSEILVQIDPLKLYLVDFFLGIQGSGDRNGENMVYIDMDIAMKTIVQKYEHDTRVCVVQKTTQDFLYGLENNCLDFVYIDAEHSIYKTEDVMKNIVNPSIIGKWSKIGEVYSIYRNI